MHRTATNWSAMSFGLALSGAVAAEPVEDKLVVEAEDGAVELVTTAPAPDHLKGVMDTIYSGWHYREGETRDLQRDDFDNPGMVYVDRGLDLWNSEIGKGGESCAGCHEGPETMAGLRAVTPRVDEKTGALMTLENYIDACVTERMGLEAWGWTGNNMKDMLALISMQSRGMAVNVAIDGPAAPFWEKGKEIYYTRFGQLEMSCAILPRGQPGQVHPRRPPEPGPDQRLPDLSAEGCRHPVGPAAVCRLRP
jgi:L-cysteine S-thiosulfotransferase